jgi:C4-dicarboxylate-specific signal transduction histidine kinase
MKDAPAPGGDRYPLAGLKWRGRTKDGVSRWVGKWRGVPKWFLGMFGGIAAMLLVGAVVDPRGRIPLITCSLLYIVLLVVMYRQRRLMQRLNSPEELAQRLNVPVTELERALQQRGIRPSILLNDIPMYDPLRVDPAMILLRPANAQDRDALLRPASQTDSQNLVTPAEAEAPHSQTAAASSAD